jgi:hypothetical protein
LQSVVSVEMQKPRRPNDMARYYLEKGVKEISEIQQGSRLEEAVAQ